MGSVQFYKNSIRVLRGAYSVMRIPYGIFEGFIRVPYYCLSVFSGLHRGFLL